MLQLDGNVSTNGGVLRGGVDAVGVAVDGGALSTLALHGGGAGGVDVVVVVPDGGASTTLVLHGGELVLF